jgi:hypothetical protein
LIEIFSVPPKGSLFLKGVLIFFWAFFYLLIFQEKVTSQTIYGFNGLLTVPSADLMDDGRIYIGTSFIDKSAFRYSNYEYHGLVTSISFGFLPFMEVSLRITRILNYPVKNQAIGDRTPSIRIKFIKESAITPSITLGLHDFLAISNSEGKHFNALYIVMTKNIKTQTFIKNISTNLGYGVNWIHASSHQFVGLFGGISLVVPFNESSPNNFQILLEHDSQSLNEGVCFVVMNYFKLLVGLINSKNLCGSLFLTFHL